MSYNHNREVNHEKNLSIMPFTIEKLTMENKFEGTLLTLNGEVVSRVVDFNINFDDRPIVEAFNNLSLAFQKLAFTAQVTDLNLNALGYMMIDNIKVEYLKSHNRLPGGKSNARLRKKRNDLLVRWWIEQNGQ